MSTNIIIELSAEDRARIDRLTEALQNRVAQVEAFIACGKQAETEGRTETAETAKEATEGPTPPATPPKEETPENATKESDVPTVTLAQIQQKVIQLAAGFGGKKKAAVREIVNGYAKKVSDIPEDKLAEVWGKLSALESED